jgi:hypothetical protein
MPILALGAVRNLEIFMVNLSLFRFFYQLYSSSVTLLFLLLLLLGCVPDSQGRSIILGAMMIMAVSQLLARSFAYGLIALSFGKRYTFLAVVSELGVFFLYKLIRQDFIYVTINLKGWLNVAFSFLARFTSKIITDFTCLLVMRNPCELGGL